MKTTKLFTFILLLASTSCYTWKIPRVKHTGPCQLIYISPGLTQFWFIRPNRELFEMWFDNPPPNFLLNMHLKDITYSDDNADKRHLIKVQVE